MNKYYRFFNKVVTMFLISIFIFPCFVMAIDDSGFIWFSNEATSLIDSNITNETTSRKF